MVLRVYLDTSVYNRPFDDQTQPRIWLESLSLSVILQLIGSGDVELVTSSVLFYENNRNPYEQRREWVIKVSEAAVLNQLVDESIKTRGLYFERNKIKAMDALHLACAEAANVDYFVTCDDRLIRRYNALPDALIATCDPATFVRKVTTDWDLE